MLCDGGAFCLSTNTIQHNNDEEEIRGIVSGHGWYSWWQGRGGGEQS